MLEDDPRFGEHNVRPRFSLIGWIAGHIRLLLAVAGVFVALSILFLFFTANHSLLGADSPEAWMDAWSAQMEIRYLLPFGWITSRVPPRPTVASSSPAFHPAHINSASKRLANKSGRKRSISNPVRQ
jgi:hypothetical protein